MGASGRGGAGQFTGSPLGRAGPRAPARPRWPAPPAAGTMGRFRPIPPTPRDSHGDALHPPLLPRSVRRLRRRGRLRGGRLARRRTVPRPRPAGDRGQPHAAAELRQHRDRREGVVGLQGRRRPRPDRRPLRHRQTQTGQGEEPAGGVRPGRQKVRRLPRDAGGHGRQDRRRHRLHPGPHPRPGRRDGDGDGQARVRSEAPHLEHAGGPRAAGTGRGEGPVHPDGQPGDRQRRPPRGRRGDPQRGPGRDQGGPRLDQPPRLGPGRRGCPGRTTAASKRTRSPGTSPGTSGSARPRSGRSPKTSTTRSSGAAGWTSAPARWATWPATRRTWS